jgi:hypothetical protein
VFQRFLGYKILEARQGKVGANLNKMLKFLGLEYLLAKLEVRSKRGVPGRKQKQIHYASNNISPREEGGVSDLLDELDFLSI